jgi:hypothetical protein
LTHDSDDEELNVHGEVCWTRAVGAAEFVRKPLLPWRNSFGHVALPDVGPAREFEGALGGLREVE